jgi:hypothetical protein
VILRSRMCRNLGDPPTSQRPPSASPPRAPPRPPPRCRRRHSPTAPRPPPPPAPRPRPCTARDTCARTRCSLRAVGASHSPSTTSMLRSPSIRRSACRGSRSTRGRIMTTCARPVIGITSIARPMIRIVCITRSELGPSDYIFLPVLLPPLHHHTPNARPSRSPSRSGTGALRA